MFDKLDHPEFALIPYPADSQAPHTQQCRRCCSKDSQRPCCKEDTFTLSWRHIFARYTTAIRSETGIKTLPGKQDDSNVSVFVEVLAHWPLINRWERFHSGKVTNAVVGKDSKL